MATEHTAEEVHQECIQTMGPELGDLYFTLWNECVLLHWKWEEYVALFGTSAERINLLNQSARAFFWVVQDSLWADVLLHIARMTDPPKSMGKDNLTIQRLPMLVATSLVPEIEPLIQDCLLKCDFVRDWRKRRIAHRDLALALEHSSAAPLLPASRAAVQDALQAIAAVLNSVELYYRKSEVWYGELRPLGNAENLLYVLRDGLRFEADRWKRIESGSFTADDFKREPVL